MTRTPDQTRQPHLRPAMETLPAYVAGRKRPDAIVLASNETPYGLLPAVADRLAELSRAGAGSRYPDIATGRLTTALAEHHGVHPERIAVGAGSVEVVHQIAAATVDAGDEVVFAWRSFEAYPIVTSVVGGVAVRVPLRRHAHDLDAMAAALTDRTRLVFVCTPNNPTGTATGREDLERFLDRVPTDVVVVVDEAYTSYADPTVVPDAIAEHGHRPNVVVTRTFSKAYGLAGLRVGYCVADPAVAGAVRKTQTPFSVNVLAQECALTALGEQVEVAARAARTMAERDRVTASLRDSGFEVPDSQANFIWLPLGDRTSQFVEHCADAGVLVRGFSGDGVRVTIGLPQENDAFLALV